MIGDKLALSQNDFDIQKISDQIFLKMELNS